ncbi:MAG: dTMP kinase [Firmicutes bacterium]|uniref:Thymidylate kinase n=1 Tax=Candidatus Gallilactobacillus intestinavium TaxID=2840838 RepID=A0A9D9E7C1_9LACO|nr:dTMP kinase [Candidatus Gallilactobacillus intestinavium]
MLMGIFITFEGADGAGKTSILNALKKDFLSVLGERLVITREPGGSKISEEIRKIIVDKKNNNMDSRTEALLFAASRRQHLIETVLPALSQNKIVFSDRYVDSSVAYQGAGRQIGEQLISDLNRFATEGLQPDLTIYFDIPSEVGLKRINNYRSNEINRLDQENLSFHKRVRQEYLKLVDNNDRIKLIDANRNFDQVVGDTKNLIVNTFPNIFRKK